jgi:hypothetical protein
MMPTANLRSDGSKLFREVYLCIVEYILLVSRLQLLRLCESPGQASTSLGYGLEQLPLTWCTRKWKESPWLCDKSGTVSGPSKLIDAQSFHNLSSDSLSSVVNTPRLCIHRPSTARLGIR